MTNSRHYWLHRISHEAAYSYPLLLDKNFLTIGWKEFALNIANDSTTIDDLKKDINTLIKQMRNCYSRDNRCFNNLWRFLQFKKGDYVIVPMSKVFSIYEIIGDVENVQKNIKKYFSIAANEKTPDIGFAVEVKLISKDIPRNYASAGLIARMKYRGANTNIDDLAEDVLGAKETKGPISLHEKIITAASQQIDEVITTWIDANGLEKIVKWYMSEIGASIVSIPAKNEPGKQNGADADVIAVFEKLKLIVYVQVKKYKNETSKWAVDQIKEYVDQKKEDEEDDGYSKIGWVISTANTYSEEAIQLAKASQIRLINKNEFISMLLDVGFARIDSFNN